MLFNFHPYLGKWSNVTNIFHMGGTTAGQPPYRRCLVDLQISCLLIDQHRWGLISEIGTGMSCLYLGSMDYFTTISSWRFWTPPIWKIWSSYWKSSPRSGVKIKHLWNHHLDISGFSPVNSWNKPTYDREPITNPTKHTRSVETIHQQIWIPTTKSPYPWQRPRLRWPSPQWLHPKTRRQQWKPHPDRANEQPNIFQLLVSTHLKNMSQIGSLSQVKVNIKQYLKPPPRKSWIFPGSGSDPIPMVK